MRNAFGLIGLLIAMAIGLLIYKFYLTQGQPIGAAKATQNIDAAGVQNDLVAIAQSERAYQTEHNAYASLDDLMSSGDMAMKKRGREGYTYSVETTSDSFRAIARCTGATPGCTSYAVDQTMEVHAIP